jgi:hypothetical protein
MAGLLRGYSGYARGNVRPRGGFCGRGGARCGGKSREHAGGATFARRARLGEGRGSALLIEERTQGRIAAAVAGAVQDGDGDRLGCASSTAPIAVEARPDERDQTGKGPAKLQGDGKEGSNGGRRSRWVKGKMRPTKERAQPRYAPVLC